MRPSLSAADSRQLLLAHLRGELCRLESSRRPADEQMLSSGSPALDRLLPRGGIRRGTLMEYLADPGGGAATLALAAAREACGAEKALVVLDGFYAGSARRSGLSGHFYPPTAAAWGIDLSRLVVLRPASEADALWALDQALRCPGVGAVWARWNALDGQDFRRLQLAAEEGGVVGLLLRPASRRGHPTWADVQWLVRPVAGRRGESRKAKVESGKSGRGRWEEWAESWKLRVELVRCRGGTGGRSVMIELDQASGVWVEAIDATHTLSETAQLARAAPARRA